MRTKTTGQRAGRINVKKLKANPKELSVKQLKKVRGGVTGAELNATSSTLPRKGEGLQHNETLVSDSTR